MTPPYWICLAAIAGIVTLELEALRRGKNGAMLRLAVALIAFIAGVSIDQILKLH